jgi:hypothetical protein
MADVASEDGQLRPGSHTRGSSKILVAEPDASGRDDIPILFRLLPLLPEVVVKRDDLKARLASALVNGGNDSGRSSDRDVRHGYWPRGFGGLCGGKLGVKSSFQEVHGLSGGGASLPIGPTVSR